MNTPPPRAAARRTLRVTTLGVACLLLAGCSLPDGTASDSDSDADAAGGAGTGRLKVALVTHGGKGDDFWELVRRGAEAAAAKDNIELTYASDSDGAGQAELVRDAIRDKMQAEVDAAKAARAAKAGE